MEENEIKHKLNAQLPGPLSHKKLAPYRVDSNFKIPEDARLSAVAILLVPYEINWEIILIERPKYDGVHSGQMAFPGGRKDKTDSDLFETACRECEEEIAYRPSPTEFEAKLSPIYIPPSNFWVHPFVYILKQRPVFIPDEREVEEIVPIPLNELLNESTIKVKHITLSSGIRLKTPYFDIHGKTIWGATAAILSELRDLLKN